MSPSFPSADEAVAATRGWVDHAVIGLNLCPFARVPQSRNQVRYVASEAASEEQILEVLREELRLLAGADPETLETTLLVLPRAFADFLEFNAFLDLAESAVEELGLTGVLQVASFHPEYQFSGTEPDDITNATNRAPYPTLHLLREASIAWAAESIGDPAAVYEANMETMRRLGRKGWEALQQRWCRPPGGGRS